DDYYHRITFQEAAMGNGLHPDNAPASLTYEVLSPSWVLQEQLSATWEWDYQGDFIRWTTGSTFFDPVYIPLVPQELRGALWLHAETDMRHTLNLLSGIHGAQRANQYLVDYGPHREKCA